MDRYLKGDANLEEISLKTLKKIKELSKKVTIQADPIHFSLIFELITEQDSDLVQKINTLITNHSYDHHSAQILFTYLWKKIIKRHTPYQEFSFILEELLEDINIWVEKSANSNRILSNKMHTISDMTRAENALEYIKSEIIPNLKESQQDTLKLRNNVEQITIEVNSLKKELNEATILARTDELTGLPNKRNFNEFLSKSIADKTTAISLVAFDVDFFKFINDEHGHIVGDNVLKYLAKIFKEEIKGRDFIARIGGEEFMLVLQNTDIYSAKKLAENIRLKIEQSKLHIKKTTQSIKLTISAGIALYRQGEAIEDFIDRADKALYVSKNNGRNKVNTEADLL